MSQRRAALTERFRTRARAAVAALLATITSDQAPLAGAWNDRLGELHTTKGEARMLGLSSIARLAHGIEEQLHAPTAAWPRPDLDGVELAAGVLEHLLASDLEESADAAATAEQGLACLAVGTADAVRAEPAGALVAAPSTDASSIASAPKARASTTLGELRRRERMIEVDVATVTRVCEQLEELRARIARQAATTSGDRLALEELLAHAERAADDAWQLRLAPIEPVLATLAAHARELADEAGKRVDTIIEADASLDRVVLDALTESLVHLVRNAIDHGVERPGERGEKPARARLRLAASSRGAAVAIEVEDDGVGIDAEDVRATALARGLVDATQAATLSDDDALDLVFRAGLSTKRAVSDVSGRGIGLDVVRRVAESLGGSASVVSRRGSGTRFSVVVPMGLSRERVIVLAVGPLLVGIPARVAVRVEGIGDARERVAGGEGLRIDDVLVPLRSLAQLLGTTSSTEERVAVIVEIAERRWALAVEHVIGERDVLRRPADRPLAALGIASASAVLDDGRPLLLPTLAELLRRGAVRGAVAARPLAPARSRQRRALVVDDSPIVRELVAELLTGAGLTVTTADVGEAALRALDLQSVDLIVTDVEMPRLDGLELVRRVRARGLRTPIVVVTTRGSAEDKRRAAELGADAYVVKTDFRESDLVEVAQRLAEVGT